MENKNFQYISENELRKKAEEILHKKELRKLKDLPNMSSEEINQIFHELKVHQIELEIQNEELRMTQTELENARSRYYELYELAPVGYCTLSKKGMIIRANLAAANLLDTPRGELIKKPISKFIYPKDQDVYYFFRKKLFESKQPQECEIRMLAANDTPFWVWLQATIDKNKNYNSINRIVMIDISDRKQVEKDLQQREKRQRLAVNMASNFLNEPLNQMDNTINDNLTKIGNNMEADRSYIYELSNKDQTISCTYTWYDSDIRSRIKNDLNKPISVPPWMYEQILSKKTVSITNINELPTNAIKDRKELKKQSIKSLIWVPMIVEEHVIGFIGIDCIYSKKEWNNNDIQTLKLAANITASALKRVKTEKNLIHQTFHDQLTGLYNRTFFKEESRRLNVKRQLPISLILGDVNGLKLINDNFGHEKGDELIKKVASIFQKTCRDEDIVTRWGGDEFLILLPQTGKKEAQKICKRIEKKCSKNKELGIPISVALGYAVKNNPDDDIQKYIKKADERMYKKKETERRSVRADVLKALLNTLKTKYHETEEYAWRLHKMARKIGKKIGLPAPELDRLFLLVTMHDIGKTIISKEILVKPSELNKEELKIIKKHPERGYRIAAATEEFSHIADAILYHHEWWDGSGYPEGLKGMEIPLLSRITAIIDTYDVMTHHRPYDPYPKTHSEAITELKQYAGTQFDPELIKVFLKLFPEDYNNY